MDITDADLEHIANFKISIDISNVMTFIGLIRDAWNDTYGTRKLELITNIWDPGKKRFRLTLITGGWSDNENIIAAVMSNLMFWTLYWQSSERGGKYIFEMEV